MRQRLGVMLGAAALVLCCASWLWRDPCSVETVSASADGARRLALLVGVGNYQSDEVRDLAGPPGDVQRLRDLLVDGLGWHPSGVCTLTDRQATVAGFKKAFEDALLNRAEPGDIVLIYFSGHGSQQSDPGGDEADGLDETLVLHDSRVGEVGDLTDDELYGLLANLHGRLEAEGAIPHISLVLDACTSATAYRGRPGGATRQAPADARWQARRRPLGPTMADGGAGLGLSRLPGLTVLAAAADGEVALERGARGVFSDALVASLAAAGSARWTYERLGGWVRQAVAGDSAQTPTFSGNLQRTVFSDEPPAPGWPAGWAVRSVKGDGALSLEGIPLPGWAPGALVHVYPVNHGGTSQQPVDALGTWRLVSTSRSGSRAEAALVNHNRYARGEVGRGARAVLAQPGGDLHRLRLRLEEPEGEGGARAVMAALRERLEGDDVAQMLVELVHSEDAFTYRFTPCSRAAEGCLTLFGPEGLSRGVDAPASPGQGPDEIAYHRLLQLARQLNLLTMRGVEGEGMLNQNSLSIQIVPMDDVAGESGEWARTASGLTMIPGCQRWDIQLQWEGPDLGRALHYGVLILSNHGGIDAYNGMLPATGTLSLSSDQGHGGFVGCPPMGSVEHILGIVTLTPIGWASLGDPALTDPNPGGRRNLAGLVDERLLYASVGPQGYRLVSGSGHDIQSPWTTTHLPFIVNPNPRLDLAPPLDALALRIPGFEICPYLPARAENHPLRELLLSAHEIGDDPLWHKRLPGDGPAAVRLVETVYDLQAPGLEGALDDPRWACELMDLRPGDLLITDDESGAREAALVIAPSPGYMWGAWPGVAKDGVEGLGFYQLPNPEQWAALGREGVREVGCLRPPPLVEAPSDVERVVMWCQGRAAPCGPSATQGDLLQDGCGARSGLGVSHLLCDRCRRAAGAP